MKTEKSLCMIFIDMLIIVTTNEYVINDELFNDNAYLINKMSIQCVGYNEYECMTNDIIIIMK